MEQDREYYFTVNFKNIIFIKKKKNLMTNFFELCRRCFQFCGAFSEKKQKAILPEVLVSPEPVFPGGMKSVKGKSCVWVCAATLNIVQSSSNSLGWWKGHSFLFTITFFLLLSYHNNYRCMIFLATECSEHQRLLILEFHLSWTVFERRSCLQYMESRDFVLCPYLNVIS